MARFLQLVTIFEGMVTVGMDVAPWIFFPFEGRSWLGLLGERLGDENTLLRSQGTLLVRGRSSLFLGFVIPGELGSLFYVGTLVRKLPELVVDSIWWLLNFSRIRTVRTLV